MVFPNFNEEKKLWKRGFKFVAGIDEAGRGPLAGPVVAAVILIDNHKFNKQQLRGVRDSKKTTAKKREELYSALTNHAQVKWAVARVSEKVIDKINILEATRLAMKRAVLNLERKYKRVKVSFLIIDGKMEIDFPVSQKSIIRADNTVFSCAAASIIAKVTRDRIMQRYHKKYSQYEFYRHKGYGTEKHFALLKKYGPCPIHRQSFGPVNILLSKQV